MGLAATRKQQYSPVECLWNIHAIQGMLWLERQLYNVWIMARGLLLPLIVKVHFVTTAFCTLALEVLRYFFKWRNLIRSWTTKSNNKHWIHFFFLFSFFKSGGNCATPIRLEFAELSDEYQKMNSFPVGSLVQYKCNPGYVKHPRMNASSICIRNQVWSEVQEFCKSEFLFIFFKIGANILHFLNVLWNIHMIYRYKVKFWMSWHKKDTFFLFFF